ncbi:hypothetical protein OAL24_00397 [Oenococcus sicerae]|nr:hypothetical protein OAL24_00397 [Oenococcus sicerae]
MVKKIAALLISFAVVIAVFIDGYLLFFKKNTAASLINASTSTTAASSQPSSASSQSSSYTNGSYTGNSVSMRWGNVQVKITITGGKITKVQTIDYPQDNNHDQQVNSMALPTYESESVKNNSSNIQAVSGATETWKAFKSSLQSALNQAKV